MGMDGFSPKRSRQPELRLHGLSVWLSQDKHVEMQVFTPPQRLIKIISFIISYSLLLVIPGCFPGFCKCLLLLFCLT